MSVNMLPPAAIFIIGALLVPLFKGRAKSAFMLLLPVISFFNMIQFPEGGFWNLHFLEYQLCLVKIDKLSLLFGYIFHLIAFIGVIYSLYLKDDLQHVAGLAYAGSAIGVVFAGDFFTFYLFWEMLTITSIFLIWRHHTRSSLYAGYRYLLVHSVGGLLLLAGILLYVQKTGSLEVGFIGLQGLPSLLIFLGFGINCAWPFLHAWLIDAYPEATITGVIFLSAFTTKTAVYALARVFPGTESLIWIGAIMTAFPIFYAVIENDLRRVLAYSMMNQVGFMVCGIGIGTKLAIDGAVAHAFNNILFKGLLFMTMGAVMYRTGSTKATDLGGLYRTMPLTCLFCIIGAASISAVPLFTGFVSESMIISAAGNHHMMIIWLILLFSSTGVLEHAGIKIPFFAFFSHDSGLRPKEAPKNMLIAMGAAAFLCIFIGVFPKYLYSILPYQVNFEPYTGSHIVFQCQLLFYAALAFILLLLSGIYPSEQRYINLDVDWTYRKGSQVAYSLIDKFFNGLNAASETVALRFVRGLTVFFQDAGSRLIIYLMVTLWLLCGVHGTQLEMKKRDLYQDMRHGTLPVGIGAALATIFIAFVFFLN